MTTAQFIAKTYNTPSNKERRCSSVFTDYKGNVYSYGYHYLLAFHAKGLDFVNVSGYSVTTAKHINWAFQAVGYDAIAVKLWRVDIDEMYHANDDEKLGIVLRALKREYVKLQDTMASKSRKNTQVYQYLEYQRDRVARYMEQVREAF